MAPQPCRRGTLWATIHFMRQTWRSWLPALVLLLILATSLIVWRHTALSLLRDREQLLGAIQRAGYLGPLVVVGLVAWQVLGLPIPGQVLDFAAGYAYGFWWGTLYCWVGITLGSVLAMILARLAGRPLISRFVGHSNLSRADRFAEGKGLRFFLVALLIPGMPHNVLCYVAGLTPLPLGQLAAVIAIARLPGVAVPVWAGASAASLTWWQLVAAGAATLLLAAVSWALGPTLKRHVSRLLHGENGTA